MACTVNNSAAKISALLVLIFTGAAAASEIQGTAVVTDGDTIRIGDTRIRLFGIDAPEGKQSCERNGVAWLCGEESAKWLRELVAAHVLTCEEKDRDRYGRTVATCALPNGRDVGAEAVLAGYALAYRRYGGTLYDTAEADAKAHRRGLWAGSFIMPWDYRRGQGNSPTTP